MKQNCCVLMAARMMHTVALKTRIEAALADADVRVVYPGARGEELSKRMTSYNLGLDMFSLV